ncbi:sugar phosphate isomerase/epimerase family protein [Bacteroidota bacterium]
MIEDIKRRSFLKKAALTLPVLPQLGGRSDNPKQDRKSMTFTDYKIKLSLNVYSFNSMLTNGEITLEEVIDYCALIGFDAIDPTAYYFPGYPQVPTDQYINDFKLKTFKKGLDISGTGVRNDFTSDDSTAISNDINLIESWARASSKLGAPLLRVFAGRSYEGNRDRAEVTEQVINHFKTCAKIGENYGVVMAFQNHDDFVHNSDQIIEIMEEVNSPWFGLHLDFASFSEQDPYEEIKKVVKYAVSWQIKERVKIKGRQVPTDYARIASITKKAGYRGYWPIETLMESDPREKLRILYNVVRNAVE